MRRLIQAVITLLFISAMTFFLINVAPGGPSSIVNRELSAEQRIAVMHRLGLDDPLPTRYIRWLQDAVRGDLGSSLSSGLPVAQLIGERLPNTVVLAAFALGIALLAGLPMGVGSALRYRTNVDVAIGFVAVLGLAIPAFWFAILLILVFSVSLQILPSSGASTIGAAASLGDWFAHIVMPGVALAIGILASIVQYTRSAMLDVLQEDYIRTARAKGLRPWIVVYRHALRNALTSVASVIGTLIPQLVGGAVVTEVVFSWPGLGRLSLEAASGRDYPLVMGITVVVAALVLVTSLTVDLAYLWLDPRIRLS